MSVLDDLRAKRKACIERLQVLSAAPAGENRTFTDEEQGRYEVDLGQLNDLDKRIGEVVAEQQRNAGAQSTVDTLLGGRRGWHASAADEDVVKAFRSALRSKNPAPIEFGAAEPRSFYQPGVEMRDVEMRDTLKSTATQALNVGVYNRFVERLVESSAVLAAGATLVVTDTGEDLVIPKETAYVTSALTAEGAAITESDPTLAVATLKAYKYASFFQVSQELANDTPTNLLDYLARGAAASLAQAYGPHLISGTGTGQPAGIVTGATLGFTGPAGTGTSLGTQGTLNQGTDALWELVGSLAEPYVQQRSTAWLMRNASLTIARKLRDTTGQPVASIGAPTNMSNESLLGRPVFVDPFMAAMANTAKSIIFGDISKYFVRMVNGVRFERSDDFAFNADLVSFRCIVRLDGILVDNNAVKYFVNTT